MKIEFINKLLSEATNQGSEKIVEKFLAKAEDYENKKSEFDKSMADLQRSLPVVQPDAKVTDKNKNVLYEYATLEHLVQQTKDKITAAGFRWKIESKIREGIITSKLVVTHENGIEDSTEFSGQVGESLFLTNIQNAAAADTFAARRAFRNMFGIIVRGEDTDGVGTSGQVDIKDIYRRAKEHMDALMDNIESVLQVKSLIAENALDLACEAFYEIPKEEMGKLWLAPSKGGCFTTEERRIIKSDEFQSHRAKEE